MESILLRLYLSEKDKFNGHPLFQHIVQYLRENHFAGVTVLRGIEGFGKSAKVHTSSMLELSTDEPIIVEIIDSSEKIEAFKQVYKTWGVSILVTEQSVKII